MKGKVIRLAIVDDHEEARIDAKENLEKAFELPRMKGIKYDLDIYKCGPEMLASKKEYDLILLDYEMPCMNGLEVAAKLNCLQHGSRFIFLSNHDMPSKKMFEVFPNGYIYKSDTLEEFQRVVVGQIERIVEQRRIEIIYYETESYEVEHKGEKEKVTERVRKTKLLNVKDIAYLETGISKKVKISYIYTISGDVYLTHKPMSHWLSLLPENEFTYSSRINAVSLRHVERENGSEIIFNNDEIDPVTLTKSLKKKFKAAHEYYILEMEGD